jgi:hypothetical protein
MNLPKITTTTSFFHLLSSFFLVDGKKWEKWTENQYYRLFGGLLLLPSPVVFGDRS